MTEIQPFTIERLLDAPVPTAYRAWTDEQALRRWWGPKGFEMRHLSLDLRPGGTMRYGMAMPGGSEMWGKWTFNRIVVNETLAFTVSFTDPDGNPIRHPMAPVWPLEVLSTVSFKAEGDRTRLVMEALPVEATGEEQAIFISMFASMNQGWSGTFEQLEEELRRAPSN
jgi:uncharacterized protein YndB with AHSA1/START domain